MDEINHGLSSDSILRMISVFRQHPEVDSVILYGSRAMGRHKVSSDIDLTLIGPRLDLSHLSRISTELDDLLLPYQIDLSILDQIGNADLIDHIRRVGVRLYP